MPMLSLTTIAPSRWTLSIPSPTTIAGTAILKWAKQKKTIVKLLPTMIWRYKWAAVLINPLFNTATTLLQPWIRPRGSKPMLYRQYFNDFQKIGVHVGEVFGCLFKRCVCYLVVYKANHFIAAACLQGLNSRHPDPAGQHPVHTTGGTAALDVPQYRYSGIIIREFFFDLPANFKRIARIAVLGKHNDLGGFIFPAAFQPL